MPPPFEAQFSKQEFDDVPQWDSDPSRLWVRPWFQTLSVLPNGQGEYYGRFFANPVENIISFPRSTFMDLPKRTARAVKEESMKWPESVLK